METLTRFIVIDDDMVNNFLCTIVIREAAGELQIETFEVPEEGFKYIEEEYSTNENPTILFLDINMPTWSGWEFLDNFKKLDEKIKNQFKIYMISSSIDPEDRQRAMENIYVADYIVKPLSIEIVSSILENQKDVLVSR